MSKATAASCANIAFIKYWGNVDQTLRIAATPSLSMNLADLTITATVHFDEAQSSDRLIMNGTPTTGAAADRVFQHLDLVRKKANIQTAAVVETESNFPAGAGIASSAAAFSALAVAGAKAAGLSLSEAELSALARRGSGSASRSVPTGYCEWLAGGSDESSYATSVASPDHWDLYDVVAIVDTGHKSVGSTGGHSIADTSPLQACRINSAPDRFERCKEALLQRDLATFGSLIEEDSTIMHSVMMTSQPALFYWSPATLAIMKATEQWRTDGLLAYYTIDAGPNVHLICESHQADQVREAVSTVPGVKDIKGSAVGGPTQLLPT
ncbi:MAG: diphosphomevalonate decarboxylase [Chloroflexota bacterium]